MIFRKLPSSQIYSIFIIHNDKDLFQGNDTIIIKYRYIPNFYQHLNKLSMETEYFPTLYTLPKIYPGL